MENEIYELPPFLSKIDIHRNLKDFLASIENDQLSGFRQLYINDKSRFFAIINEMILRGFKFTIDNALFPKTNFDNSDYIVCKEPRNKGFLKIDFDVLGIGGIINEFTIADDSFFNKIPLDSFSYFNPRIDKQYLKALFQKNGFEIKKYCVNENEIEKKENDDLSKNYILDYYYEGKFKFFIR